MQEKYRQETETMQKSEKSAKAREMSSKYKNKVVIQSQAESLESYHSESIVQFGSYGKAYRDLTFSQLQGSSVITNPHQNEFGQHFDKLKKYQQKMQLQPNFASINLPNQTADKKSLENVSLASKNIQAATEGLPQARFSGASNHRTRVGVDQGKHNAAAAVVSNQVQQEDQH